MECDNDDEFFDLIKLFILITFYVVISVIGLLGFTKQLYAPYSSNSEFAHQRTQQHRPMGISSATKEKEVRINSTRWEQPWPEGVAEIIGQADLFNRNHEVLNEARYGKVRPIGNNGTGEAADGGVGVEAVFVIQAQIFLDPPHQVYFFHIILREVKVHDRVDYLRYVVESFSKVRGIERALLVFSHDLISEPVNQLVRNITFARVIQLLYPYSIQLFSGNFPGFEKDHNGANRRKSTANIKNHVWWKPYGLANSCYVLRFEDDHLASPDVLHVMGLMARMQPSVCPECLMLGMGKHGAEMFVKYRNTSDQFNTKYWRDNTGMAFTYEFWDTIRRQCGQLFCTYNDGNYDYTLAHLSYVCLPGHLKEMRLVSPRVLNVGDCGATYRIDCKTHKRADKAMSHLDELVPHLFPSELKHEGMLERIWDDKPWGGWDDERDHELCILNTYPTEPIVPPLALANRSTIARRIFSF